MAFHDCEDFNTDSLLEEHADQFLERKILSTYGYNFSEYLALPRNVKDILERSSERYVKKKIKERDDIISGLKDNGDLDIP